MQPARRSSVSLCMIVKDEAEWLPRSLESARDYVDEICVVDTGSSDATIDVARSFGAKLREIEWPGSFAEARNVSLEMATGDWILVLDADEMLRPGEVDELNELVDDPRNIAAFLRFVNHGEDGESINCLILRLFRNDPTHRFEGAIHEQVIPSIIATADRTGQVVVKEALNVDHYGYTEDVRVAKDKDRRNREHFERALEEDPDNAYVWFKYGDFLRRFDDPPPMLAALERACALVRAMPQSKRGELTYCAEAFSLQALERIKGGELERAGELLDWARERCRPTAMLHWVSGHLALRTERWADAKRHFEDCRALDGQPVHIPAQPGITSGRSVFGIARAMLGLGEGERAFAMLVDGADRWPECEDLTKAAIRVEIGQHKLDSAIRRCTWWLDRHQDDAEAWRIGAELLLLAGMAGRARTWAERALALSDSTTHAAALGVLGEAWLASGELESALDTWNAGFPDVICRAGLLLLHAVGHEPFPPQLEVVDDELVATVGAVLRRLAPHPIFEATVFALDEGMAQIEALDPKLADVVRRHVEHAPAPAPAG